MSDYPQHDRLRRVADTSQTIGEFVDWLADSKGVHLAHHFEFTDVDWNGNEYTKQPELTTYNVPNIQALLAEFFGVDLAALEAEKRAMLGRRVEPSPVDVTPSEEDSDEKGTRKSY